MNCKVVRWGASIILWMFLSLTAAYGQGTAKVNKVWLEYNVVQDGEKGIVVHSSISTSGLKNKKIKVVAFFYDEDKDKLMGGISGYRTTSGHVCVSKRATSTYENSTWKDFKIFMPLSAIPMASGKHDYYVRVRVYSESQEEYISPNSDYIGFIGTGRRNSNNNNYQTRNNPQKRSSKTSDREWREETAYGGMAIHKVKNGRKTVTSYSRCNVCRGALICRNCGGTGKCQICQGAGVRNTYGYLSNCLLCNRTGKCSVCKGKGRCACNDFDYPGYVPAYTTFYDENGNIINTVSFMLGGSSGSSGSSGSESSSSERSSSSSSGGSCYVCGGTGVDKTISHGGNLSAWVAYVNGSGEDCPYCHSTSNHQHAKCAHCNVPRR